MVSPIDVGLINLEKLVSESPGQQNLDSLYVILEITQ